MYESIFWIGLIDLFVFLGVFVECEGELKLKSFERRIVDDLSWDLDV